MDEPITNPPVETAPETPPPTAEGPALYVAIGASAGGLEAVESFFINMPPDSGMAFVVIQHLSPDYRSLMVELLSKKTTMPVRRAEDGAEVLSNHVYLIPPKKNLTIKNGRLVLSDQGAHRGLRLPIDIFLESLALDQRDRSVAVILSGTGSDGMRGVRTIKEHGGLLMAQDEETARFDGMPRAAISTGLVDFILPPEQMPGRLLAYMHHPCALPSDRLPFLRDDEDGVSQVMALLRDRCKVDFSNYKPSTVNRRIERRMTIAQTATIREYVDYIIAHPGEAGALYRDLLIGVTSFFRDPEAFDVLEQTFLRDILRRTEGEVRLWVAGCSTGEEAYTLAILVRETLEELAIARDVKIFATDIDRDAIHTAGAGVYPESIIADIPPRLLTKYFTRREERYQVTRALREMVVFAAHNLVKDPPFTKISLISCRNLLIYLQPVLQNKVLELFNFSLLADGVLLLGASETTGDMSDCFVLSDPKWKIYRSLGKQRAVLHGIGADNPAIRRAQRLRKLSQRTTSAYGNEEERVVERFLDSFTKHYVPLAFICNEQMEVLHIFGDPSPYLRMPSGRMVNDLSRIAAKDLSTPLASGVLSAFRDSNEVRFSDVRLHHGNEVQIIDVVVRPLPTRGAQEPLAAVFIEPQNRPLTADAMAPSASVTNETEARLRDLEQDLQFTRENLQATIEELETSNEELQATNEELLSSNEELQSTNEELQSTNEELFTANAENQRKIFEMTELHNDVENLLGAPQIAQILLDENLEVRRFSAQSRRLFDLREDSVGRSIALIPQYVVEGDVVQAIRDVTAGGGEVEREVRNRDGKWYLMRVTPYSIGAAANSGVVVSFIEITRIKETMLALADAQKAFEEMAQLARVACWQWNPASSQMRWSEMLYQIMNLPLSTRPALETWAACFKPADRVKLTEALSRAAADGAPFDLTLELPASLGQRRWVRVQARAWLEDGRVYRILGSAGDASEIHDATRALRDSQNLFDTAAQTSQAYLWMTRPDGSVWFSQRWLDFTGRTRVHSLTREWEESLHPDDFARCIAAYNLAFDRREPLMVEYRLRRSDGVYRWVRDEANPRFGVDHEFLGYLGAALDIDDSKTASEILLMAQNRSQALLDSLAIQVCILDEEGRRATFNQAWREFAARQGTPLSALPGEEGIHLVARCLAPGAGHNGDLSVLEVAIADVIHGHRDTFEFEAGAGAPAGPGSCLSRITPCGPLQAGSRPVMVSRYDISPLKLARSTSSGT